MARAIPLLAGVLVAMGVLGIGVPRAWADDAPARDLSGAIDAYLGGAAGAGGPAWGSGRGSVGYDEGFWVGSGAYSLRFSATVQARYEAWRWDADQEPLDPWFDGDLAGFSLPRATLKLSGTAPCNTSWYAELEVGDHGQAEVERRFGVAGSPLGPLAQSHAYDPLREAWVEWSLSDLLSVRAGRIRTATTRQLMTPPERQQFCDVSLASAFVGSLMPGYTDRNRDHGLMVHGRIGVRDAWSYLVTVTNGDGADGVRDVLDDRTGSDLAVSARVNHAFRDPIGYEEGALGQVACRTQGEVGAWAWYEGGRAGVSPDAVRLGVDVAWGRAGLSFTGAATWGRDEFSSGDRVDYTAYLVQVGYHVPRSPWEVAARWSRYAVDNPGVAALPLAGQQQPLGDGAVSEFAVALNHYLGGYGNKIGLDVAYVQGHDGAATLLFDPLTGYPGSVGATGRGDAGQGVLVRFQWQLAL